MNTRYLSFVFFLLIAFMSAAEPRGQPTAEGIVNFGKVNEKLFRGAQPDTEGIRNLKRLGVKAIVCLRTEGKAYQREFALAQAQGLICTNIPLNGVRSPSDAEVRQVLSTIKSLPHPVFVHCQHGCDRTGTIIACYRIQYEGWSNEAALKEAERYGISKLERGMRAYILRFGKSKTPVVF